MEPQETPMSELVSPMGAKGVVPRIQIRAQLQNYGRDLALAILDVGEFGEKSVKPADLVFSPLSETAYCPPTMVVSYVEAQNFIDSLWDCGLRPSGNRVPSPVVTSSDALETKALRAHLEDMRSLAFGSLKLHQPEEPKC